MRIVLDTNALLISIPTRSPYRVVFDSILNGDITLLISNDIISEYMEVLERKTNYMVASNITELLLNLKNVIKIEPYFNWFLIDNDPDDNKFVDCAIAGNAMFLVSNDKHFQVLNKVDFPKVELIEIKSFLEKLNDGR